MTSAAAAQSWRQRVEGWSDARLVASIGGVLFVLAAWPLLFLPMPPYQDLPDHLATLTVLLHPERYPEFVSNGFLKANSLFVIATYAMAKVVGVVAAGRIFAAIVLGSTAFALPYFVLAFTDRSRLLVATLVMAPMVHNWWTLMGMLNFAAAFPLALVLLVVLARQAASPTNARGAAIAGLAALLWLTHAIALGVVGLLALVEALRKPDMRARMRAATTVLVPLAPVGLLVILTMILHATQTHDARYGAVIELSYQDNGSALYDLWAHWTFGMSPLSAASIVPAIALGACAIWRARMPVPFFSAWGMGALLALYVWLPYEMPGFGYVGERVIPFLWAGALARVPARVPGWAAALLAASSLAWAAGLAADLFRAEADLDAFVAAAPSVPEGARMLTLNFEPRVSSRNTWSLLHASGMYTLLRSARPQDVWADSPSMPIRRAQTPAMIEDPVRIRQLILSARTPSMYCASMHHVGLPDARCKEAWATTWRDVWDAARDRYEYVLLWGAPDDVLASMPPGFTTIEARGMLRLVRVEKEAR